MPIVPAEDPEQMVRQRRAEIERTLIQGWENQPRMDEKELAEREEAAQAYAGEDEPHFVRFLDDCVQMSVDAMLEIRREQSECWDVFNEREPTNYAFKESWQSRVVVPKPYSSVQFFLAIVRKAFDPQFLSIENERDVEAAEFWQKLMELMLSRNYANFPINFTDATGMGAAVGQSMEMIPVWRPGKGLRYILIEPWKIHRDADSLSRQPQSGMYWIHQEWLDYYDLKDKEKNGQLLNIPDVGPGGSWGNPKDNVNLTQEELKRRRDMLWQRSSLRTMVLTSEFWGTVLDKRGELLMPNATFTVAGDKVIRLPKQSPYPNLRWPGTGFSPLPHLLRFDGRSLVQGIKSLWYFMCSLMALHADNLNWLVNPPKEIDISSLVDQEDVDDYPGKTYLTRGTVSGQQAVRTVQNKGITTDILANMNFADQRFQEGVMINYAAQGLPGYRAEVTAREAAQNLEQSMSVVGLMGENLEDGALNAIMAGAETVAINITYQELAALMGEEVAQKYYDKSSPTQLRLPQLSTGTFRVSGISTVMRNQEIISAITNIVMPMFDPSKLGQIFLPYGKPYALCKAIEKRLNLKDEGLFVDEGTAQKIDQAQQQQQEESIQHQAGEEAARVAGAHAAVDKTAAQADKARGEAAANLEQAGLFKEQAGAVANQPPAEASPGGIQ